MTLVLLKLALVVFMAGNLLDMGLPMMVLVAWLSGRWSCQRAVVGEGDPATSAP